MMIDPIFLISIPKPGVNLPIILPEIIVAVAAAVVMLYDCFKPNHRYVSAILALLGVTAAGFGTAWLGLNGAGSGGNWNGMIAFDSLRMSFTLVFLIVTFLTILISSVWVENEDIPAGEYYSLLLFATVGMMLMASGNDLVIIFLGLETLSIATYVMAGLRRSDLRSNESAMKYFILGSFASGFLLYGMALIYGATGTATLAGTTNIAEIAGRVGTSQFPALLLVGAAMLIIGFGFKIASVPFHVWTPDVYEGAPTPVTAFMAVGSKAAAFASFLRIFALGFPLAAGISGGVAGTLSEAWVTALAVIAILTMTVGNVAAIVQNNVKRMLAYSSIAHAGYALVGFVGAGAAASAAQRDEAILSVAFYMLAYAVTNLGAFAIVTLLGQKNDRRTEFEDYNGIGFKSPVLAFTLSLFMLSLFGLPLTAGFMGKILVFRPAIQANNPLLTLLVVAAVINSAISAYYYLRFIIVMFFKERTTDWTAPKIPASVAVVLAITVFGVLYLGIFSDRVIEAFRYAPPSTITTAAPASTTTTTTTVTVPAP